MYYLAITFIFLGLGCLLYLFIVRTFQKAQEPEQSFGSSEMKEYGFDDGLEMPSPADTERPDRHSEQRLHGAPPRSYLEERKGTGSQLSRSAPEQSGSGWYREAGIQPDRESVLATQPRRKERFEGVLFLDESGQAVSAAESGHRLSPDLFSRLRRLGPCEVQYSDRSFLIHSESARLQYRVDDLRQILFLDSGFAFIPEAGGNAPLILTREVERFKKFLRDNSL